MSTPRVEPANVRAASQFLAHLALDGYLDARGHDRALPGNATARRKLREAETSAVNALRRWDSSGRKTTMPFRHGDKLWSVTCVGELEAASAGKVRSGPRARLGMRAAKVGVSTDDRGMMG